MNPASPDTFLEATIVVREQSRCLQHDHLSFAERAEDLPRRGDQPIAQIAKDSGIAE